MPLGQEYFAGYWKQDKSYNICKQQSNDICVFDAVVDSPTLSLKDAVCDKTIGKEGEVLSQLDWILKLFWWFYVLLLGDGCIYDINVVAGDVAEHQLPSLTVDLVALQGPPHEL